MEDLFIKIYIKKEIKYCAGCLNTEDVTRLSKMQNYCWIFTALFTNLYLTEELHDSWICSWCVRKINNARKLLNHFQAAQNILSRINEILNTSESHEIKNELCSKISELKNKSRLYFNSLVDNSNFEKSELEVKCEELSDNSDEFDDKLDEDYQIDLDISFEPDNSIDFKVLRSRKGKVIPETGRKLKKIGKVKKHLNKKEKHSAKSNDLVEKRELKVVKEEFDDEDSAMVDIEKLRLSTDATECDLNEIPLPNLKTGVKIENEVSEIKDVRIFDATGKKRHKKQKRTPRNYLPNVKRIPCKECDREFTKEIALHNHMIRKHKKKYQCDKCDRVFIKAEFVKTHMAKVHEPKRGIFECALCGTIYKNRHKMVQHMNKHEKYGPSLKDLENIVCDHCGKLCDRSNIKKHLIKHSEVKNYHCEFCDASFKTPEVREEHTRRKHMDPDVGRRFPCPQCPKKFFTSTQVKYHMTAMHFVQGKPCPVCSKCFATKSKVREHILRVHEKIPAVRDKQCDFCDKAFSTRRQLKHHRYTHTGEKPYKCDLCTSAYNQKHCLSVHKLRAHNVETPKTHVKRMNNATVTNLHDASEFSSNVVNWYPLNLNDGRQDLFVRETSN